MKLKTLKEMGVSDADVTIYDRIRKIRNDRNIKDLIRNFYDLPMFYFMLIASACISTLVSIWFSFMINKQLNLVTSITFDTSWLLICYIFLLNLLVIAIFIVSLFCMSIYHSGSIRKKDIEKEIYVNEGLPNDIEYKR